MKKYLIFSVAFIIMTVVSVTNVSATGLGSQSIDVTVGEVDKINTDNEEQNVYAPNTGIFGLDSDHTSIVAGVFFTIPVAVILVCLFRYIHHRHAKMGA